MDSLVSLRTEMQNAMMSLRSEIPSLRPLVIPIKCNTYAPHAPRATSHIAFDWNDLTRFKHLTLYNEAKDDTDQS
jgi:hypothetical protein